MTGHIAKLSHQVFFWLKSPGSNDDLNQLLAGIRSLEAIDTVRGMHIGVPAATEKDEVIDTSYSASGLLFFDNVEDQTAYQTHPLHQKFIAEHRHLWSRVVAYDSISTATEIDFGL